MITSKGDHSNQIYNVLYKPPAAKPFHVQMTMYKGMSPVYTSSCTHITKLYAHRERTYTNKQGDIKNRLLLLDIIIRGKSWSMLDIYNWKSIKLSPLNSWHQWRMMVHFIRAIFRDKRKNLTHNYLAFKDVLTVECLHFFRVPNLLSGVTEWKKVQSSPQYNN